MNNDSVFDRRIHEVKKKHKFSDVVFCLLWVVFAYLHIVSPPRTLVVERYNSF